MPGFRVKRASRTACSDSILDADRRCRVIACSGVLQTPPVRTLPLHHLSRQDVEGDGIRGRPCIVPQSSARTRDASQSGSSAGLGPPSHESPTATGSCQPVGF